MTVQQEALAHIDRLIARLKQAPSVEDRADGWTEQSWAAFQAYLRDLRANLSDRRAGQRLARFASLGRELDAWGITGGPILNEAAALSRTLRTRAAGSDLNES